MTTTTLNFGRAEETENKIWENILLCIFRRIRLPSCGYRSGLRPEHHHGRRFWPQSGENHNQKLAYRNKTLCGITEYWCMSTLKWLEFF